MNANVDSIEEKNETWEKVKKNLCGVIARRVYWSMAVIFILVTALAYGNHAPVAVAIGIFALLVVAAIGLVLWDYLTTTKQERKEREEKERREKYRENEPSPLFTGVERWIAVRLPLALLVVSSFLFWRYDFGKEATEFAVITKCSGRQVIVGPSYLKATLFAPFLEKVEYYPLNQARDMQCTALTKDKVWIRADMRAELALEPEMMEYVLKHVGVPGKLEWDIENKLCRRLYDVVRNYNLADMPSSLVLEHHTLEQQKDLHDIGLEYTGVIEVSNTHVFAGPSPF
jgi:Ca2+/Na+ antiporter